MTTPAARAREEASLLLRDWIAAQDDVSRAGLTTWLKVRGSLGDRIASALTRAAADAFEQAAKVAEGSIEPGNGMMDTGRMWRSSAGRAIAAAIRALATQEAPRDGG